MTVKVTTRRYGADMRREFRSEDGRHARRYVQNLSPLMDRARHMAHRRDYRRKNAKFVTDLKGQVPMSILIDYLGRRGIPLEVYARNEGGVKDKFNAWLLKNRDFCRLQPDYYTVNKPGQSQIVVPERPPNNSRFKEQSECQSKTTES